LNFNVELETICPCVKAADNQPDPECPKCWATGRLPSNIGTEVYSFVLRQTFRNTKFEEAKAEADAKNAEAVMPEAAPARRKRRKKAALESVPDQKN